MSLFSPTINTGATQPIQASGVETPSVASQTAPVVAKAATSLLEFFGDRNAAEAKMEATAVADKAKSSYMQELITLGNMARTSKGVSTSALRTRADKLTIEMSRKYPSLAEDFLKIRKDISSTAGLGKTLAEGTPEEKQEAAWVKEASDNAFIKPGFTEEEKSAAVKDYLRTKESGQRLELIAKQQGVDATTRKVRAQDALVNFFRSQTGDFSRKSKLIASRYQSGEIDAIAAKAELDLLMETVSSTANQIGANAGAEFVGLQTNSIKTMYENAKGVIEGAFALSALDNRNKAIVALQESKVLEDEETAGIVALSGLVNNQSLAMIQKLDNKATIFLGEMSLKNKQNPNPVVTTEDSKRVVQVTSEALMAKVKAYNTNPSSLSENEMEALETSANKLLEGLYDNQMKIKSPKDVKDLVTLLSDPQFGKYLEKSGGLSVDAASRAGDILQMEYADKVMPKVRKQIETATISVYSADPITGAPKRKQEALMDYVDINTGNGAISFSVKQDAKGYGIENKGIIASSVKGLNKELAPILNEVVRMRSHLEGTTNYDKFLEENAASIMGLRSEKEPKVDDSIDPTEQLNKQAKESGIDLSQFSDGEYEDNNGNVVIIQGGKVVGVR